MKTLKYFGFILLAAVLLFAGFIIYSQITFYNPPQELVLNENSEFDTIRCDSTFSIMSWNIGYAGLGDNMVVKRFATLMSEQSSTSIQSINS